MMGIKAIRDVPEEFPSVDLAYKFAIESYDIAWKRWDAMENRIHGLMALAAALTFAVPAAGKAIGFNLNSVWFYLTLGTFILLMAVGFFARWFGTMRVIDPSTLFNKWLHYSEWEFKKNFIYFAGAHYDQNITTLEKKWKLTLLLMSLFTLEVVWVALLALGRP